MGSQPIADKNVTKHFNQMIAILTAYSSAPRTWRGYHLDYKSQNPPPSMVTFFVVAQK